eukprot:TRINITY_DN2263_c0_g1_i1.p1 TRINITY_DN2263_c0_g1~~TRINITY_DN2263_c0_g1_i1.p1  ORF type:complete len:468 (-),score=166.72 TRINITY_DN2263_c0_g1_i1:114-1517(-)
MMTIRGSNLSRGKLIYFYHIINKHIHISHSHTIMTDNNIPSSPSSSLSSSPPSSHKKRKHIDVAYENDDDEQKQSSPSSQNQTKKIDSYFTPTKSQSSSSSSSPSSSSSSPSEETPASLKEKKYEELGKDLKKQAHKKEDNEKIQLWISQLEIIRKFRNANKNAPVDEYGSEVLPYGDEKQFRFQTLVSLMLSSQTRDQVTGKAVRDLQAKLKGGLTVDSVRHADPSTLSALIRPVSFYVRKVTYLQKTAEICATKYGGDIPNTLDGLVSLPGVGPKMGHLTMLIAWKQCVGIGVDVHVHRISNRLGWVHTTKPEQTRLELEGWLPREHWLDVNVLLVGFGQVQCLPVGPKCSSCPVHDTCPTGQKKLEEIKDKGKKKNTTSNKADEGDLEEDEQFTTPRRKKAKTTATTTSNSKKTTKRKTPSSPSPSPSLSSRRRVTKTTNNQKSKKTKKEESDVDSSDPDDSDF